MEARGWGVGGCLRSGSFFDEDISLVERLPVARTALDCLGVAVALHVADERGVVRKVTLEFGDRVELPAVVVQRRQIESLAGQLDLFPVGVDDHRKDVEELEAESILRHLELRGVTARDLCGRAFAEKRAWVKKLDVRRADIVHWSPLGLMFATKPRGRV